MADTVKTEAEDKAKSAGIRVFVYGSLKRGFGNHPLLERGGADYLGDCEVGDNLSMVSLGSFPGVVRRFDGAGGPIHGEVYRVSEECLHSLDMLEGHPEFYRRQKIGTPWKGAWIYLLPTQYLSDDPEVIESGVWTAGRRA